MRVRLAEALERLHEDALDPERRLRAFIAQHILERDPLEVLHRVVEVEVLGVIPEVEDANSVRVGEDANRHDLALEALDHLAGVWAMRDQHLERDVALHRDMFGEEDGAKTTLADHTGDLVRVVDHVPDVW